MHSEPGLTPLCIERVLKSGTLLIGMRPVAYCLGVENYLKSG